MRSKRNAHQHVIKQPGTSEALESSQSEPAAPTKPTSGVRKAAATVSQNEGKRKLSKAERKRLKKGVSSGKVASRKEQITAKETEDFRDPLYYIGSAPAGHDAESERHLSVHGSREDNENDIGRNELRGAVLDLAADDNKGKRLH